MGLFLFVINALVLWLVSGLVRGVKIVGFGYALVGSIVLSVLNALVGFFI
ncbi:MAG: phage holin family protein [Thermodesulfobacteriota bacterium]